MLAGSAKRQMAVHALAMNEVLVEVVGALEEVGVRPVLIKGPVIARWLYDDPYERSYRDLDLLVDPARFDEAEAVLERLGFRGMHAGLAAAELPLNAEHAHTWRRVRHIEQLVDLHHKLLLIEAPPARAWLALSHDARPLLFAGVRVQTPRPDAHLVIVALHAAQHGVARERSIEDLRRAIARVEGATWGEAAALATELGAGSAMREGLRLVEGGVELADRLALADDAPMVVRLLARSAPVTTVGVYRLLAARGVRGRSRLVARKLVPTPSFMRSWKPLASRGRLGLALAYAWRPAWLAVKVPRGVLAWGAAALPGEWRRRSPRWWRSRGGRASGGGPRGG